MSYSWAAIYNDGTFLRQNDTKGEVSSREIDRTKLKSFVLFGHDGKPVLQQHFEPGKRLIYFRRKKVTCSVRTAREELAGVAHYVGWQETIKSVNMQHISVCFEDGRIENLCRFQEGSEWTHPPADAVLNEALEVQASSKLFI